MTQTEIRDSPRARMQLMMRLQGFAKVHRAAKDAGLAVSTFQHVMSRNAISRATAEKIANTWPFEADWIERGVGPMWHSIPSGIIDIEASPLPEAAIETLIEHFALIQKPPIELGAGGRIPNEDESATELYAFRRSWLSRIATSQQNLTLFGVRGDSMRPALLDGDTVLVDTGRDEIGGGAIFAIRVDEELQIRSLEVAGKGIIRAIPANKEYEAKNYKRDEIQIIGEAIWVGRLLRRSLIKLNPAF